MKKKVKSLIIAASVAAIAGIGAVSFAAWNTKVDKDVNVNGGATANVETTVGFVLTGEDTSVADLTLTGAILPYDQGEGTRIWSVALGDYNVKNAAYTFTLSYATDNTTTLATGSAFYYSISDTAVAAAPTDLTSWTELATAVTMEAPTAAGTVTGKYLNIVLKSDDMADMNKTGIKFTLTLADATTGA